MVKEAKCVIWDLDNTLWDGILAESNNVTLKPQIKEIIKTLDSRGILQSIASKNNFSDANAKLIELGLENYFLYPEIHWNPKSLSVQKIQEKLNIGLDSIIFVDDQPFERDEVSLSLPEVETMDSQEYLSIINYERLKPQFINKDSKRRRLMYMEDSERKKEEDHYAGTKEEFLRHLNLVFSITEAKQEDLERAVELTIRTNQLNSTGISYGFEELKEFMNSPNYKLLVCELTDKYGSYGKIGLALLEIHNDFWHLKMLLMSCRVMARGVGTVFLTFIMKQANKNKKLLLADFKQTSKNKLMFFTYKLENFKEKSNDNKGNILLENDLSIIKDFPSYIEIRYSEL